jgi:ATP-binding cassette, subfamily B, bacterial PglK
MEIVRKIYALLTPQERRRVYLLLPVITVMALMQVIGIASVTPFLALVANPNVIETNYWLNLAYTELGFESSTRFLIFTGLLALGVILFSNAFTAYTSWLLMRFSWDTYHTLSERLLISYLYKPYVFFLNHNTSDLAKNILSEVSEVVRGVLVPLMNLVARTAVAVVVLAALFAVDWRLAGILFTLLGGAYAVIFLLVRQRLARYGKTRVAANRERFSSADEALSGIKEIKLLGKETIFLRRYSKGSQKYTYVTAATQVISQLPSYLLEAIAFGGILLMVIYLLATGQNISSFLALLGLYVFGIYRLMPALQQIFGSVTAIRANQASLDAVFDDLKSADIPTPHDRSSTPRLPFEEKLELRGVTFRYPGAKTPLQQGFDLVIKPNTSVAFVGSTGSGKTTTVDLILGLLRPEAGHLVVDGVPITDENLSNWQMNLGYVPQFIYLSDDTIANNIAFGVHHTRVDMAAVERAARLADIHDFIVGELPEGYATSVGERGIRLSGGQRQRLGIARALYHDPKVLVLDEATSALDNQTEEHIFEAVSEIGKSKTIIMIAHRISTVRDCDVIYVLEKGRVVAAGTYDELIRTSAKFRAIARHRAADAVDVQVSPA